MSRFFNCSNCPAHCCSYEHIEVNERDIKRLARHFELDLEVARHRFTRPAERDDREVAIMRHKKDPIFGSACRFLDIKTRKCTIYEARPEVCKAYPGRPRCGFYDFLMAERRSQGDPEHVPDFTRG